MMAEGYSSAIYHRITSHASCMEWCTLRDSEKTSFVQFLDKKITHQSIKTDGLLKVCFKSFVFLDEFFAHFRILFFKIKCRTTPISAIQKLGTIFAIIATHFMPHFAFNHSFKLHLLLSPIPFGCRCFLHRLLYVCRH